MRLTFLRGLRVRVLLRAVLVLALVALALLGYKGWKVYQRADALRLQLRAIEAAVPTQLDPAAIAPLEPMLAQAHEDVVALRDEVAIFLPVTPYLTWVPTYGSDIAAAGPLLDLGADLTEAGDTALNVLIPVLQQRADGQPLVDIVTARLTEARPQLEHTKSLLDHSTSLLNSIPVASLTPQLREPLTRIAPLVPKASSQLDLALGLPEVLGGNGRRTYLLLIQDPNELRATGGFIGAVGLVTLDKGQVVDFTAGDSYAVDRLDLHPYPDPPQAMLKYMGIELWLFRDSNWSPDFPTSAREAIDLYKLGQERDVDGVVAIDQSTIEMLLSTIGPVAVEGEAQPVSAQNYMQYFRRNYDINWETRKAFLGPLSKAILGKLTAGSGTVDTLTLTHSVQRMLDERHLFLYVKDQQAAGLLANYGWDGAVRPSDQDYLMVVDSNVGVNKVMANVHEVLSYTVDLSTLEHPTAELRVQHTLQVPPDDKCLSKGHSYEGSMIGCYWGHLRALVPQGSRVISSTLNPIGEEWLYAPTDSAADHRILVEQGEANTAMLSTSVFIPRGETRTTTMSYALPSSVVVRKDDGWHYQLKIQKQSRTENLPVNVTVQLPPNATLVSSSLKPKSFSGQLVSFDVQLVTDQQIEVVFRGS